MVAFTQSGFARALLLSGVTLGLLSGCAHTRSGSQSSNGRELDQRRSLSEVLQQDSNTSNPTFLSQNGEIYFRGMKLENTQFDYPVTMNARVEYWIDYFTGRGRGHFARYLERSELFIPFIRPLLKQNGMPEDLVYLAMIESGFNNHARSHAKAVGPWQFISATGKRYGLMVNWWVDERRDTRKSTLAAVNYLKDLYTLFNSWELAAAAYNAGEAKVARAIRRFGTKDFWTLSRSKFFRPETRDYVPKIMAAAIVAKNRTQFGFAPSAIKPGEGEAVAGDGVLVKVEPADASEPTPSGSEAIKAVLEAEEYAAVEELGEGEDLSPATVTIPANGANAVEGMVSVMEAPQIAKPVPTPHVSKKGEVSGEELAEFEVQSPADLLKVARAAGISYHTVKSLNPEVLRWCTPPNVATYRIKLPASVKDQFLETYNHGAFPRKVQFLTYKVRRGETLARIARHFGIRVDPISDLNGLSPKTPLQKGAQVLLPMPNDRSRTLASLEILDPPTRRRVRRIRRGSPQSSTKKIDYKRREAARARSSLSRNGT